jgi:hypothetical protein
MRALRLVLALAAALCGLALANFLFGVFNMDKSDPPYCGNFFNRSTACADGFVPMAMFTTALAAYLLVDLAVAGALARSRGRSDTRTWVGLSVACLAGALALGVQPVENLAGGDDTFTCGAPFTPAARHDSGITERLEDACIDTRDRLLVVMAPVALLASSVLVVAGVRRRRQGKPRGCRT